MSYMEEHATYFLRIMTINTVGLVLKYAICYAHDTLHFLVYCSTREVDHHEETRNLSVGNDLSCRIYIPFPFSFAFVSRSIIQHKLQWKYQFCLTFTSCRFLLRFSSFFIPFLLNRGVLVYGWKILNSTGGFNKFKMFWPFFFYISHLLYHYYAKSLCFQLSLQCLPFALNFLNFSVFSVVLYKYQISFLEYEVVYLSSVEDEDRLAFLKIKYS